MWGSSLGGARSTLISAVLVSVFSAFMFSTEVELWLFDILEEVFDGEVNEADNVGLSFTEDEPISLENKQEPPPEPGFEPWTED